MADAVSPAVRSSDGRLAYVTTARSNDIRYRTSAVVGTPPELIINWSPDGRRIAIFENDEVRLVDPATATSVASQPAIPGPHLLAPAFLADNTLIGLTNCCIGDQRLAAVKLTTGKRTPFATLPAPPENLSRVRRGVLVAVTAARQLVLLRQGQVQIIARGVAGAAA